MKDVPFYSDWQFWSAVIAFIALFLSQLPPLKLLFKKGMLTIEKYDTLFVYHNIGSPFANLFVILKNVGGLSVYVHSIDMKITCKNSSPFLLKGRGYMTSPSEQNFTMLTPFELSPNQTWAHNIRFNELLDRTSEKEYKAFYSNVRDTITEKNRIDPPRFAERHEIDGSDYERVCKLFNKNFKWFDGEYEAEILVKNKEGKVIAKDLVKFTLFENESDELKEWLDDYKYGNAIHLPNSSKQVGVWSKISN